MDYFYTPMQSDGRDLLQPAVSRFTVVKSVIQSLKKPVLPIARGVFLVNSPIALGIAMVLSAVGVILPLPPRTLAQATFPSTTFPQGVLPQGAFPQGVFPQGAFPQGVLPPVPPAPGFSPSPLTPGFAAPPAAPWINICDRHNTAQVGSVTMIGRLPGAPYAVVVPGENPEALALVRQCVPDAFISKIRRGKYIQAGVFRDRATAEYLSVVLREQNLDARVIYLP